MIDERDSTAAAAVGLGANLGDRAGTMARALGLLDAAPGVRVESASSLYETEPVGVTDQPRFLNAAALVRTSLQPRALLETLLGIERSLGRDRSADAVRWGPRAIDLDLLLFGDRAISERGLETPHPRLHERAFVLAPLAEVCPDHRHPVLGATASELWASLTRTVGAGRDGEGPAWTRLGLRRFGGLSRDGGSGWTAVRSEEPGACGTGSA